MRWRWDYFVMYCLALLFAGWLAGFLLPGWLAATLGGLLGIRTGTARWFEESLYLNQGKKPKP